MATIWPRQQVELLRYWWGIEPRADTARRVGRSVHACELMAGILFGSVLRERWDREERWEAQVAAYIRGPQ
jgi:hypothetical protein